MPAYDDDYHDLFRKDIEDQMLRHHFDSLGELFALLDGVIDKGHGSNNQPVDYVFILGGSGLYEVCAPALFGVYVILDPPGSHGRPVLKALSAHHDQGTARAMAKSRL
ncbi:hypothetical protein QCE62_06785 [Caballeronia sp. LZ033]|uniref:hypothetical protein n=1 Tax=Caballeronia sp. LZ033 TaxID=3038566 RepID=UPI0028679F83|nr:hypothetical protein [Caballeronia sp. LZ033]MDR5813296.1 hypothetical protein [Caballeronia sp. LZ033]